MWHVLESKEEALRLAQIALDEKIDRLNKDGFHLIDNSEEGQIARNYQKAFELVTEMRHEYKKLATHKQGE